MFLLLECLLFSSTTLSMASKPAFSARVLGTISIASANLATASCSLPFRVAAYSRRRNAISISGAPPPTTSFLSSTTSATACKASSRALSRPSRTCCVPPRRSRVAALFLAPVMKVMIPLPTLRSSTRAADPRSEDFNSSRLVTMLAPVALASLSRSFLITLLRARTPACAR